jgi:protein Tex
MTGPVDIPARVAADLALPAAGVAAVCGLLADGATVPFIARYRKEATGGLDEVQIRAVEERRGYLVELEERREVVLASIADQGKLTPELERRIRAAASKAELEDLYLPYKPKRRTRATIAREKGLEPLAERILAQPERGDARGEAAAFVDPERGVADVDAALAGARDIAAEAIAENPDVRAMARRLFAESGELVVQVTSDKRGTPSKFEQYYDFREPVKSIPSHRFLAIRRGENEDFLRAHIEVDGEALVARIAAIVKLSPRSPFFRELEAAIRDGARRLLAPSVENDLRGELKLASDRAAVEVFAGNLRNLLLAAPLGQKAVIGIDPGLRTGCKCAAVSATGSFLGNTTIYPISARDKAARDLVDFVRRFPPSAIAVGNGTGGREAEAFVRDVLREAGVADLVVVQVSESGASVYSASDAARDEFPDLDVTVRGAISIARRLQDPLAELVKIDPKAIGVGQYQHDVHQPLLQKKLVEVVESCVNHVGVALNTASAALLSYVAGVSPAVAKKIVERRDKAGPFRARAELLKVSGLGPRTYQQCAGFLRIPDAANPLDRSAVHPERYALVERIAGDLGVGLDRLVGDANLAGRIDLARYLGDGVGLPTLKDIAAELAKPGRDPRATFEPPRFRDDVREMSDLAAGMTLEGVVTNVTAFGAFVDVGVHQDGLVHVSQLADRFVRDPAEVVKVGDRIKVRVIEVDLVRKRIALSARSDAPRGRGPAEGSRERTPARPAAPPPPVTFKNNPFARLGDPKSNRKK